MDDNIAIKVENVSKKYCKSLKRSMLYGVKDIGKNALGIRSRSHKLRKDEFWAVDDVSFELKMGETLGIIGPNGSGKTTLLKMLNGIFWPDKGKITVNGRVGALIAVGAGFHPLLTGRENIYVNAAILGMTKEEVDAKFDEMIEFADIGEFIDIPVKHYSSGMYVRLGFAVAVHCEPDILLVDEVLAVGDMEFRAKCYKKIAEMKERLTVVMVSHSPEMINRMCGQTALLVNGSLTDCGDSKKVQGIYLERNTSMRQDKYFKSNVVTSLSLVESNKPIKNNCIDLVKGEALELTLEIERSDLCSVPIILNLLLFNSDLFLVISVKSDEINCNLSLEGKITRVKLKLDNMYLSCGIYYLGIGIFASDQVRLLFNDEAFLKIRITSSKGEVLFEPGVFSPKINMSLEGNTKCIK